MPWEYLLMREGWAARQKAQTRREAGWVSYLLTALTGSRVTVGQLLGDEDAVATVEQRVKEGERKLAALMKKKNRARKRRKD